MWCKKYPAVEALNFIPMRTHADVKMSFATANQQTRGRDRRIEHLEAFAVDSEIEHVLENTMLPGLPHSFDCGLSVCNRLPKQM